MRNCQYFTRKFVLILRNNFLAFYSFPFYNETKGGFSMGFGSNLIRFREEQGISRKELADMLGVPYTTLRGYETETREPGHIFLARLSKIFDVSIDYLLGLSDDPKGHKKSLESERFEVNDHEKLLIIAYRANHTMQPAVDKLLGITGAALPSNFDEIQRHANEMAKNLFKNQPTPAKK